MASTDAPPEILPLIADPHRWRLLTELARSDRRVGELTDLLGEPQNLVSYHLGQLRSAGIVSARRSSADRRDVYYRADLPRCRDRLGAAGLALHPGLALAPPTRDPAAATHRRHCRVLFLCTGNSARSQMAEALLEHRTGHAVSARSAGSRPKPLHPNAVRVMGELGIDISGNRSKPLTRFARSRFDRVVTLCDKVREICPELPGAPATWSIADPAAEGDTDEETLPAFRAVADEVDWRLDLLIADLEVGQTQRGHHAK